MKPKDFWNNKTVLITGSARGIGRETARKLLTLGAKVILNGRHQETLQETQTRLKKDFPNNIPAAFCADLENLQDIQNLAEYIKTNFDRLDVLINNAGLSMRGLFEECSFELTAKMMQVNALTAINTTLAFWPMLKESQGRVLFVSTLSAVRGFSGVSLYGASKAVLEPLSQSLNWEGRAYGIKTGVVFLGFTENDPEKQILDAQGGLIHHQRSWSLTQKEAAESLLKAVQKGKTKTITTCSGKILVWFQRHFPDLVDFVFQHIIGSIHQKKNSLKH